MIVLLPFLESCKRITSFFDDSRLVAEVGDHKLYESEILEYVPKGISSEDSVRLAHQYIQTWAKTNIFLDVAEKELSKEQKDVSKELEDYRISLLRFRYEQEFVNQRLDTAVTAKEIEAYYENHQDMFKLKRPIMKVRFVRIAEDSPNVKTILKKMSSEDDADLVEVDSLAYKSALKYTTNGNTWMDAALLAQEFDTDYETMLSCMKKQYINIPDGMGNINVAYVLQLIDKGKVGPVEFYKEQIKDIILSARKQKIISDLEKDLMEKADSQESFVIY